MHKLLKMQQYLFEILHFFLTTILKLNIPFDVCEWDECPEIWSGGWWKKCDYFGKIYDFFTFWRYLAKCQIALKYCGLIMSDINIRYVQEVSYIASSLWKIGQDFLGIQQSFSYLWQFTLKSMFWFFSSISYSS